MRRPSPEWLLLPVFVLPLAVAATLAFVARSAYLGTLASYRRDGAAHARRWLDDPQVAAWTVSRFDGALRSATEDGAGWDAFRRGDLAGRVRRPGGTSGGSAPWILATDFAGGLTPAALADPNVRIAVEGGAPIAGQPGADAATAAFASFVSGPEAETSTDRLRAAPLAAGAKLYLLRRSRAADPDDLAVLAALRDLGDALDEAGGRLAPGAHAQATTTILVPAAGGPLAVVPGGAPAPVAAMHVCDDPTRTVRLLWTPAPSARPAALWTGTLDAPLAGTWTIESPAGAPWWRAEGVARWTLPVAAGCVAFLAIPAALLLALRRRRRLDAARARFITEIAHDLRTPVAALRLHAELLASGRAADADRGKHVAVLGREAARVSSLLANLLDLSRLERGTRPFDRAAVDVAEVVRETVREFGVLYPQRAADVETDLPAEIGVVGDRTALARALANLLDNAGKFTPAGTKIRVRAESLADGGARIVVADEGPGIAAADRTRVFRPYERGSAAAVTAAPGTGLGLALVRELVEGMGGRVALLGTHADGVRGATFEITLPGTGEESPR